MDSTIILTKNLCFEWCVHSNIIMFRVGITVLHIDILYIISVRTYKNRHKLLLF